MRFCKSKWVYSCQIKQLSIIELVSHGNRTDWIENGRSNCERERERWMFLGNQNCALLLIDMFITANISNDFSDCLHSRIAFWQTNFVQSNCAKNTPPSLSLPLSLCLFRSATSKFKLCIFIKTFSKGKSEKVHVQGKGEGKLLHATRGAANV